MVRDYSVTRKSWDQLFVLLQVSAMSLDHSYGSLFCFYIFYGVWWYFLVGPWQLKLLIAFHLMVFHLIFLATFASWCQEKEKLRGWWWKMPRVQGWQQRLLCEAHVNSHSPLLTITVSHFRLLMLKGLWKQPRKHNRNQEISKWQQGPIAK